MILMGLDINTLTLSWSIGQVVTRFTTTKTLTY